MVAADGLAPHRHQTISNQHAKYLWPCCHITHTTQHDNHIAAIKQAMLVRGRAVGKPLSPLLFVGSSFYCDNAVCMLQYLHQPQLGSNYAWYDMIWQTLFHVGYSQQIALAIEKLLSDKWYLPNVLYPDYCSQCRLNWESMSMLHEYVTHMCVCVNDLFSKVWDETTYPFPNFNGCPVEVWEWIS